MIISRIITLFILLVFLSETFDQNFITFVFYTDQTSIAKSLCVNRDKPQMHCNGKCQLQEKLNQQNNKPPERKTESHNETLSSKSFFASVEPIILISIKKRYFIKNADQPKDQSSSFFHPPESLFM